MKPLQCRNCGVALLEVLLAVTVVGIGMGTVLTTLSNSSRLESLLVREATARDLAADQLLVLELKGALTQPGETGGDFDAPYSRFVWRLRVQPSLNSTSQRLVRLSVIDKRSNAPIYTLESYMLD